MKHKTSALEAFELVYVTRVVTFIETAGGSAQVLKDLGRLGRKLSNIGVHACNGTKYSSDNGEAEQLKDLERVYSKIENITEGLSLHWYHQTDPRGAQLYISNEELSMWLTIILRATQ